MAALLRGGMRPQAYVSPAQLRAPRALLRRRLPLAHTRAERRAHGPHTHRQDNLPAIGTKRADKAPRDGGAARCAAPAVPKRIAVDRALLPSDDARLGAVERPIVHTAKPHAATTLSLRHTVPGLGTLLGLVLRYARHDIHRFPRGQDVVSDGRLGQCAQASAGQRLGTAGAKRGQAHLPGAWSEAAGLCRSAHPAAQPSLARWAKKHAQGNALPGLAQQLARAVYDRLPHQGACAREQGCQRAGRRADEPGASRDHEGLTLPEALDPAASPASWHAKAPLGPEPLSPAPLLGPPLVLLCEAARVAHGLRGWLRTRAWFALDNVNALSPLFAEDGMREQRNF